MSTDNDLTAAKQTLTIIAFHYHPDMKGMLQVIQKSITGNQGKFYAEHVMSVIRHHPHICTGMYIPILKGIN